MRKLDQACGRLNGGPGWFAIEHPPTRPRESVEDGNDQPDGDQTLDCPPRVRDGPCFHAVLRYQCIQRKIPDQNGFRADTEYPITRGVASKEWPVPKPFR